MNKQKSICYFILVAMLCISQAHCENPLITGQFSADPTARVFNGKMYVYPSHDIPTPPEKSGRKDWFCMEDYHVFSSTNLSDWIDHGVIVNQKQVPWVDGSSYSMWAPDCVEKNGKYYFYFPANIAKDSTSRGGFGVGVGISDKPEGPFVFQPKPIKNVRGIDPCVLIDKDGQAYIYWVQAGLSVAKLNANMLELDSEPKSIEGLPNGFKEGPFAFERNGKYYFTYPLVQNKTEQLAYSIGDSPMGPFTFGGIIMDESPTCWTNHQSIVQYKGQWYLFYHHNDYSPNFDKNRSICADSLFFEADGSIRKVIPTLRGVGQTLASATIQLDRYSDISKMGASIAFMDTTNTFAGWKTILETKGAWVQYNAVLFEGSTSGNVQVRVKSQTGGILQIRLDKLDGPVLSQIKVPDGSSWLTVSSTTKKVKSGSHTIFVSLAGKGAIETDWIRFD